MTHAVQDRTQLEKYIPHVKDFIRWALDEGAVVRTVEELDLWLADFLEHGCYGAGNNFDWGSSTFFGVLACFPEYKGKLNVAYRAYKGWEAIHIPGEGVGIPIEVVFVLAQHFRDKNMPDHALIVETSAHLYLRQ